MNYDVTILFHPNNKKKLQLIYRNGPYEDHPIPIILPIIQLVQTSVQKENKMSYL